MSPWIRFPGLDVMYWGSNCLTKVAGMLGPVLKLDGATIDKRIMMYARVLVDINIVQGFHDEIFFENELGELTSQRVEYVWKPVQCYKYNQLGHLGESCRSVVEKPHLDSPQVDQEGFQKAQRAKGKTLSQTVVAHNATPTPILSPTSNVVSRNSFYVLQDTAEEHPDPCSGHIWYNKQ